MAKQTTTSRGLGWDHQQQRKRLLARHVDGSPCPCGTDCRQGCPCQAAGRQLPMYRDARLNVDGMPLEADHSKARGRGNGKVADRLMLATCNRSRGMGHGPDEGGRPKWWTRDWVPLPG